MAASRLFCIASLAALILHQGDADGGVAPARQALAAARQIWSVRVRDDFRKLHNATTHLAKPIRVSLSYAAASRPPTVAATPKIGA